MNNNLKKTLKGLFGCLLLSSELVAQEHFSDRYQSFPCDTPCQENECDNQLWGEADYLYWKIKNSPTIVPLVATAPIIVDGGPVIGLPGASVVLGGKSIQNNWRSGGRFALGCWLDDQRCLGTEVTYFFLPNASKKQTVFSSGLPGSIYLSVPFFDTTTGIESSSPVAAPGLYAGEAALKVVNSLQGAELNGFTTIYSDNAFKFNLLAGFRYLNFNEHLTFSVNSPAVNIPGEVYQVKDQFHAENNFYGGQIGLGVDWVGCGFSFNVKGKVAFGAMCEEITINGKFITNNFNGIGVPQTFVGGYFALPSNIGHHRQTHFAIVPDVNLNIGYQATDTCGIKLGYTFLYVNKMLWAGKQMNRNINPTQSSLYEFTATPVLTGEPSPKASLKNSGFWAQGISLGIDLQF